MKSSRYLEFFSSWMNDCRKTGEIGLVPGIEDAIKWADNNPKETPWISCVDRMPDQFTPRYSDDDHRESDYVLVWDSFYGPSVDRLWNGEWCSEKVDPKHPRITADVVHKIVAWMPIPKYNG